MGRFIINLWIRGKKHLKIRDRWENMSLRREKLRLFLTFIMGICVLTGCNQFSSMKEHTVSKYNNIANVTINGIKMDDVEEIVDSNGTVYYFCYLGLFRKEFS